MHVRRRCAKHAHVRNRRTYDPALEIVARSAKQHLLLFLLLLRRHFLLLAAGVGPDWYVAWDSATDGAQKCEWRDEVESRACCGCRKIEGRSKEKAKRPRARQLGGCDDLACRLVVYAAARRGRDASHEIFVSTLKRSNANVELTFDARSRGRSDTRSVTLVSAQEQLHVRFNPDDRYQTHLTVYNVRLFISSRSYAYGLV